MTDYCAVYISAKDEAEAVRIGRALVSENLAACVNIHPIKSIFRWGGEVSQEDEAAMFVKTRANLAGAIITRVKELHSYEVPCIVCLPIASGNPDYLNWISQSTK